MFGITIICSNYSPLKLIALFYRNVCFTPREYRLIINVLVATGTVILSLCTAALKLQERKIKH